MDNIFAFLPEQASTIAADVDAIYLFLVGLTIFFTVTIFSAAIYFAVKYRRKSDKDVPDQIHGNNFLELVWTIIPTIICMILFVWGVILYMKAYQPPSNAREIFVVGKQWMGKIQHPEGPREINELHVPINRPIKLLMTTEDVIHSFYIPAFRVKMDTVPGKYTQTWFEATKPGEYHIFCAEYCGTEHSQMIGKVIAMTEEDYQAWLDERINPNAMKGTGNALLDEGKELFTEMRCHTCHSGVDGAQGPSLIDVYGSQVPLEDGRVVTANENYIRESILQPNKKMVKGYFPLMPTYEGQLDEEQILALIAHIKSLSSNKESQPKTETGAA